MVTEIIKNLRYYTSTDLKTLKSMNATSQVCVGEKVYLRDKIRKNYIFKLFAAKLT